MTTQDRPGALAPYSQTPTVPVSLSALGIVLTMEVPPVGAIILGAIFIGGALYTAYRLATREQRSEPRTDKRSGLHLLGARRAKTAADYVRGCDVLGASMGGFDVIGTD